jgi:hypothetical protein
MEVINQLKYPLMNLSVIDEADQSSEVPFDEPFQGLMKLINAFFSFSKGNA